MRYRALSSIGLFFVLLTGCSSRPSPLQAAQRLRAAGDCEHALNLYDRAFASGISGPNLSIAMNGKAECLLQLDRVNEAFQYFQKVIELDPRNFDANLRSAELLVNAGLGRDAQPFADAALALRPNDSHAQAVIGSIAAANGEVAKAEGLYQGIMKRDPQYTSVSIALAELYANENKEPAAEAVLLSAESATPQKASPSLALGRMYEEMGNVQSAEAAYRRAAAAADGGQQAKLRLAQFLERTARVDEAEQVLRQADQASPSATSLADLRLITGRATESLLRYSTSLREWIENPAQGRHEGATILARYVEAQLQAAHEAPALAAPRIASANALLQASSHALSPAAHGTLSAELALAQNDLASAKHHLAEATSDNPNYAPALYLQGIVADREGNSAKAIQAWETAIASDSGYVPARMALAYNQFQSAQYDTANNNVVVVVRDEPANILALNLYARTLAALKEFDSARLICRRAMAVAPRSADPWATLGDVESAQSNNGAAFIDYERALLIDQHSSRALNGLLGVYRHGHFTRQMIVRLEQVASAPPVSATMLEIAGDLYADHGWRADASRAFRAALQADPTRNTAAITLARLDAATQAAPVTLSSTTSNTATLSSASALQKGLEDEVRNGDPTGIASNNLAWMLATQGRDLDRALDLAQSAHRKDPSSLEVLDTLGFIYLKRHQYSQAAAVLNDAARLVEFAAPTERKQLSVAIYEHLAQAWESQGLTQEAAAARAKSHGV